MRKSKKVLALLLACVLALPTVAIGASAEEDAGLSDEIITVAINEEPDTIVPDVTFLATAAGAIVRLIYEPLVFQDPETLSGTDEGLVTNVEVVDDTHISITLREGIYFQSGNEFTTADVQYEFEQGILGGRSDFYTAFAPDEDEIIDDYNMILALEQPWAQAIDLLGYDNFLAVDSTILSEAGGAATTDQYLENAGTGKYKFTEWVPGEYILLERNEDYWDQDNLGYYAGYKFIFITDDAARAMAVQSGDADIALACEIADYEIYEADPTVNATLLASGNSQVIFMNCEEGRPFSDERVREAAYLLLDFEAIKEIGNSGLGEYVDTDISPVCAMWDGITESATKEVDVERAQELLAEAGYEDGLDIKFRTWDITTTLTLIQEQLRAGGINVEFEVAEKPVHFEGLGNGDYDMCVSGQQGYYYSEPVRMVDGYHYSFAEVYGGTGYKDEEFGDLCQKCLTTYDETERKEYYAELQQYMRDEHLVIGLYTAVELEVMRPDLENINLFGIGVVDMSNLTGD